MEKVNSTFFIEAKDIIIGHSPKRPISNRPFSFELPEGAITGLIGTNGSGKTTLLQTLIGGKPLLKGVLKIYGRNASSLSSKELSSVYAILPQEPIFPFEIRVKHFLELAFLPAAGLFQSLPAVETSPFSEFLEKLQLTSLLSKPLKELSSGERQRVFLARALFQGSKLILMDEPTNHLDPKASREFWETVSTMRGNRKLDVLLSTHDLNFVERECDWILALHQGDLFFCGSKKDFFDSKLNTKLF